MLHHGLTQQALWYAQKCNSCGFCRAVCPLLEEIGPESAAPRGRVFLAGEILAGRMAVTPAVAARLGQCLVCRHCLAICPTGVRVDLVMMAARALIKETVGAERLKVIILKSLASRWQLISAIAALVAPLQGIVGRRVEGGQALRLNWRGMAGRTLPVLKAQPFLKNYRSHNRAHTPKAGRRVAFFAGCFVNFVDPEIGYATVRVLEENGIEVVIPQGQTCCGTPMLAAGQLDLALPAIRKNIDALLAVEAEAIVTSCASCGTSLKEWWGDVLAVEDDAVYLARAREVARKTCDISEFLAERVELKPPPGLKTPLKATYHDPCHLAQGRNIRSQPRALLSKIPGLNLVEMAGADDCCGCGGFFSYDEYPLTRRVNEKKIKNIAATGAEVVLSGCPGCNLQIRDGMNRFQIPGEVWHTVQILDRAYRGV
ncbi:MAG: glycolate oxidase iron-sulfur subunit [Clostridia bacterium]|nr:glycolate oxidase iron-sulfur subunit [Clostridia bacterium]